MGEKIYPYAVARIRVLEKNLLNTQTLNNMAEAKSAEEAVRILKDAGYGNSLEAVNVYDYEKMLTDETKKLYSLMEELVPKEEIFKMFLYKNDYHNLKVLLKQEVSSIDGSKYLMENSNINIQLLKDAILNRKFDALPKTMAEAATNALDAYSHTQSGQVIDIIVDKAVYKHMSLIAKESKNKFTIELVEMMCDLTNIKTFLRVIRMKKSFDLFLNSFLEEGSIKKELFEEAFKADNPASFFYTTKYNKLCEDGFSKSFTEFEKLCDNFQIEFISKAKYLPLTIEPLVAYLFAKEAEIKMARIIIISKLNKIDTQIIKERLRESYV